MTKQEFLKKWIPISHEYHKVKFLKDKRSLKIQKEYHKLLCSEDAKQFIVASFDISINL